MRKVEGRIEECQGDADTKPKLLGGKHEQQSGSN